MAASSAAAASAAIAAAIAASFARRSCMLCYLGEHAALKPYKVLQRQKNEAHACGNRSQPNAQAFVEITSIVFVLLGALCKVIFAGPKWLLRLDRVRGQGGLMVHVQGLGFPSSSAACARFQGSGLGGYHGGGIPWGGSIPTCLPSPLVDQTAKPCKSRLAYWPLRV